MQGLIRRAVTVGLVLGLASTGWAAPKVSSARAWRSWRQAREAERRGRPSVEHYLRAFSEAIGLTLPGLPASIREEGFLIAARCLHADLVPQLQMAIAAYLNIFPQGKRRGEILIERARLDLALGAPGSALAALEEADGLIGPGSRAQLESLRYAARARLGRYRDGESQVTSLADHANPDISIWAGRERRRLENANSRVGAALREVEEMLLPAERSAMMAAFANVFTPAALAPRAALLAVWERNRIEPHAHVRAVRCLGAERWTHHRIPVDQRYDAWLQVVERFPQAEPEVLGHAMRELAAIAIHERNDEVTAGDWLERLRKLPGWQDRAAVTSALIALRNRDIDDPRTLEILLQIHRKRDAIPFDDGWFPPLDRQRLATLIVFAALFQDRPELAKEHLPEAVFEDVRWRTIPGSWLIDLALTRQPEQLRAELLAGRHRLDPRDRRFVEDALMPLHQVPTRRRRLLMVALASAQRFPQASVRALQELLRSGEDHRASDHVLASLAQIYQVHRSEVEAQAIWHQLRRLYPRSIWLR